MTVRILLYDVETAPLLGYAWGVYDQNILEVVQPTSLLSFAYAWLGDDKITCHALPDYPDYQPGGLDDRSLIQDLWKVLDEADIVVGQNSDAFDNRKANSRFLIHGLPPPSPYKTFDTLKAARKHFRLDSNKLADLGRYLGVGTKVPHAGWAMWRDCIAGDVDAWEQLKNYNVGDVALLREVYLKLRPWANHPDVTLYGAVPGLADDTDGTACPACGSPKIQRRGTAVARSRKYQRLQCQDCGHWHQGKLEK